MPLCRVVNVLKREDGGSFGEKRKKAVILSIVRKRVVVVTIKGMLLLVMLNMLKMEKV